MLKVIAIENKTFTKFFVTRVLYYDYNMTIS